MLEEYDMDKLNPRPRPYAKELKKGKDEAAKREFHIRL